MESSRLLPALLVAALVWPVTRSVEARQVPVPGTSSGRFADPYLNVHAWPNAANGGQALYYFMAAQQRAARLAQADQEAAGVVRQSAASTLHLMHPGGASAGSYFGRTTVVRPQTGPPAPARYNRYGHYFGNRGR